jgi:hypothetical protein
MVSSGFELERLRLGSVGLVKIATLNMEKDIKKRTRVKIFSDLSPVLVNIVEYIDDPIIIAIMKQENVNPSGGFPGSNTGVHMNTKMY